MGAEQYRFPVEYQAIIDEIIHRFGGNPKLRSLLSDIEPFIEQRDRTLEDFLSNLPAVPSSGFDALVIRGATTDNDLHVFPTVFEAIRFLDTFGLVTARIGLVARGGTITETAVLGSLSHLKSVEIVGTDGGDDAITILAKTRWSHGGFSTTGTTLRTWVLDNIYLLTGSGKTEVFQGSNLSITARNTYVNGGSSSTTTFAPPITDTSSNVILLYGCVLEDINMQGTIAFDSIIFYNANNSHTQNLPVWHYGCYYAWTGAKTVTNAAGGGLLSAIKAFHLVGCTFGHTTPDSTGSTTDVLTFVVNGTNASVVVTGSGDREAIGSLALSVSNHAQCYIDVQTSAVTVGAGSSSATYPAQSSIGGTCSGTLDVTGPCFVNASAERAILRGQGIGGSLNLVFNANSGTALTGTAVTDSSVVVSARRHPSKSSSSQKGYAFDASSARCVFTFAGGADFPTSSTNAGTKVVVIDENGVPSTALPDIITAGGPTGGVTTVPVITWDAKGRLTAVTVATIATNYILNTLADAKGDLIAATASDTWARVAVGSDGKVLTADAASTAGVKWATPATSLTKFTSTFGDGVATTFTIAHGLGTADITVTVRQVSTGEFLYPNIIVDATNVSLDFGATAYGPNDLKVVVIG